MNTPFIISLQLLLELHRLELEGKLQTDEADLIRDKLDKIYYRMTTREQLAWTEVSEILHEDMKEQKKHQNNVIKD